MGQWSVYFPPQPAGGPFQITIAGSNKLVLDDVLIGDVWFASGQSNMEMPLAGFPKSAVIKNSAEEISHANQPGMRLLFVNRKSSTYPLDDIESDQSWTICSPETAAHFSAVAYFFGRDLATHEHVPIGLIDSSWGGTPAEAWVSLDGLGADASLMPVFAGRAQRMREEMRKTAQQDAAKARAKNQPFTRPTWGPEPDSWEPGGLFNGMVAPLIGYAIKGVIWYQGESNASAGRAPLYEKLFPALISDWRRVWSEGDFPFLFVQLANYNAHAQDQWPVIREAQRHTLSLANTGMAVTADVGDPGNIHPADNQTVGTRLALWARARTYGEKVEYAGPLFRQASAENDAVRVWFDHPASGLKTKSGGGLEGFEVAGDDHHFVDGKARVDGASVLVSSPQVKAPKYVRYGWQNAPILTLYNADDLPASPFTSEEMTGASQ